MPTTQALVFFTWEKFMEKKKYMGKVQFGKTLLQRESLILNKNLVIINQNSLIQSQILMKVTSQR